MRRVVLKIVFALGAGIADAKAQTGAGFIFQPLSSGTALPGTEQDNHASSLVELPDADAMAAWFAGTKEGAPDVAIYGARLHGGRWSAPVELARAKDMACWNPVLFHTKDRRLCSHRKLKSVHRR
jgi:predicted neuraminidase